MQAKTKGGLALAAAVIAGCACAPAQATGTATKDQAFAKAKACLVSKHVARFVGRARDGSGGGYAFLTGSRGGSASWTYRTTLGQVSSTTVGYGGVPGPSAATKSRVEACLKAAQ